MKPLVVVMGVSGSGKSTVGPALADRLDCPFFDGDDHHPPANVAKMAGGTPLDDEDRAPWLDGLNRLLRDQGRAGEGAVLACSALARRYRRRLADGVADLRFVYLAGDADTIRARMRSRTGHFMGERMLAGQLAALEEPTPDEAIRVDADRPVAEIVDDLAADLT